MCTIPRHRKAITSAKQRDVEESERSERQQQRPQHLPRERRRTRLNQNGLWMQSSEQIDAQMNEWDQQRAENSKHGAVASTHRVIVDRTPQHHVAYVDEPEKKSQCETRVPRPVRSPDRSSP